MNKQDAKRAATLAAATTVGSASGIIGAGSIINNSSNEDGSINQNIDSMDIGNNNANQETSHIHNSSEETAQSGIGNVNNEHEQLDESSDGSGINQTSHVVTEPVNPDPEIFEDQIEDNNVMVMYGGPIDPEPIVQIDPAMYGGPVDCIYDPLDDVTESFVDDEEMTNISEMEQTSDDSLNNVNCGGLDDIDYIS